MCVRFDRRRISGVSPMIGTHLVCEMPIPAHCKSGRSCDRDRKPIILPSARTHTHAHTRTHTHVLSLYIDVESESGIEGKN